MTKYYVINNLPRISAGELVELCLSQIKVIGTKELTTRNSALSTLWFPSVSNMLKAILKPDCGSKNEIVIKLKI